MKIISVISVFLLAGYANTFETRPFNPEKDSGSIAGVRYYEPTLFKASYITVLTDTNGAVVGSASDSSCTPKIQKEELTALPDYTNRACLSIILLPSLLGSSA